MKFLIAIFFVRLFAQQSSPTEILENVRTRYSQLNDISARFTQTVKMKFKQNPQKRSGTVQLKKLNKYRIETAQQTVVTDGNTVWMYNPMTKQVLVDSFKTGHQPFSFEQFLHGFPKDVSAETIDREGEYYIFKLKTAKLTALAPSLTSVKIWVDQGKWTVEKVEYSDKNNTVTFIELSDILINKGVDDKEFQFEISKDMHVVDLKTLK